MNNNTLFNSEASFFSYYPVLVLKIFSVLVLNYNITIYNCLVVKPQPVATVTGDNARQSGIGHYSMIRTSC